MFKIKFGKGSNFCQAVLNFYLMMIDSAFAANIASVIETRQTSRNFIAIKNKAPDKRHAEHN